MWNELDAGLKGTERRVEGGKSVPGIKVENNPKEYKAVGKR